jgi:hypothetical protein
MTSEAACSQYDVRRFFPHDNVAEGGHANESNFTHVPETVLEEAAARKRVLACAECADAVGDLTSLFSKVIFLLMLRKTGSILVLASWFILFAVDAADDLGLINAGSADASMDAVLDDFGQTIKIDTSNIAFSGLDQRHSFVYVSFSPAPGILNILTDSPPRLAIRDPTVKTRSRIYELHEAYLI